MSGEFRWAHRIEKWREMVYRYELRYFPLNLANSSGNHLQVSRGFCGRRHKSDIKLFQVRLKLMNSKLKQIEGPNECQWSSRERRSSKYRRIKETLWTTCMHSNCMCNYLYNELAYDSWFFNHTQHSYVTSTFLQTRWHCVIIYYSQVEHTAERNAI